MLSSIGVALIAGYQRWLSPRKGFACAHRTLHAGPSCSEFAKGICRERGTFAMLRALRRRIGECRRAAEALRGRTVLMAAGAPADFEFAGHPKENAGEKTTEDQKKKSSTCDDLSGGCALLDACFTIGSCL